MNAQITNDWTLKLFSLGVAVVLFQFVQVQYTTPKDVDFRLEYRLADDMVLTNDAPTILHTTLQGPWADFRSFEIGDLEPVLIDLTKAEPGTQRHLIDISNVNPPAGMRVQAVRPSEIEINLDRRVERQIPVRADIPDTPALGYEILDVRLSPNRVRVMGPAGKVQSLDYISTRSIDVLGREDDLTVEVDLRGPPPPIKLLDKRVSVFVEIGEEFVQKSFGPMRVGIEHGPKTILSSPQVVTLIVKGPRRVIDRLAKESLEVYVDVGNELEAGKMHFEKTISVRPELPERTQFVGQLPKIDISIPKLRRHR